MSANNTNRTSPKELTEKQSHLQRIAVLLAAMIVILAGIRSARAILSPIFMAAFLAVLLMYPFQWLKSRGMSQFTSLLIVIVTVLTIGVSTMTIIGVQLTQFVQNIPQYRSKFNKVLTDYNLNLGDFIPMLKEDTPPASEKKPDNESRLYNYQKMPLFSQQPSSDSTSDQNQSSETPGRRSSVVAVNYIEPAQELLPGISASDEISPRNPETPPASVLPSSESARSAHLEPMPGSVLPSTVTGYGQENDPENEKTESSDNSTDENTGDDTQSTELMEPVSWSRASETAMEASSQQLFTFLGGLASELSVLASNTFIIMLLVIFMLIEGAKLPKKIAIAFGKRNFTNDHIKKLVEDIRQYMAIKTFVSLLVGILVYILLIVSRVQYPLLWGSIAFLLNFIPNIGSVVAAIPPIILATVDHGLLVGAIDAAFFALINCIVGYI
ncbi:MAG: AI-2E family transporter, partial [Thermoguttaceae bacterium]|nr:AI-2E family transporter [Thermoguttaceae bacterium]